MYQQPEKCPVCSEPITVTRLYCPHCDTTIDGHFSPAVNPFGRLSPEQLQFLISFIRCEGRFTALERELNLSYPTLRNRLNEVLKTLGFEPGREEPPARLTAEDRRRILEDLDQGVISLAEAQRMLRGKKEE